MQRPRLSALLGIAFLASRVVYFVGYSQGAKHRVIGSLAGEVLMMGMCGVCIQAGIAPLRQALAL